MTTTVFIAIGEHYLSDYNYKYDTTSSTDCDIFCLAGNCAYKSFADTTMTQDPDASSGYISDVSTCWSLCLQLRVNGEECVAAVLEATTICKLYVGTEEVYWDWWSMDRAPTPQTGSTVMLRRCFEGKHNNITIIE